MPPRDVDLVGRDMSALVRPGDTLLDIGRRHDVGYDDMHNANPGVDMWLPPVDSRVVIPNRHILPDAPRVGIVLNLPELRLYYYRRAAHGKPAVVETYPVGIGRMDWSTPLGKTRIVQKIRNPAWYPPKSIREAAAAQGDPLPKVVPAGPDNPLGLFAMRLAIPGYLIHSTNKPWGVGMRVSHGCVRMYPENMKYLFPQVPVNTPVRIVNQPFKAGWYAGTLYLEAHPTLDEDKTSEQAALRQAVKVIADALGNHRYRVDFDKVKQVVRQHLGIPIAIGRKPPRTVVAENRHWSP